MDFLVETAQATRGVLGARMVGGGFGGCMIALLEPAALESARERIVRAYREYAGAEPWQHVVESAPPAGPADGA